MMLRSLSVSWRRPLAVLSLAVMVAIVAALFTTQTAAQDGPAATAGPVDLRWKFAPNSEATFTLKEEVVEKTTDRGRQISQNRATAITYKQVVKAVSANGTADLELTFQHIRYKHTSSLNPTAPVDFDSDSPENLERAAVDPSLRPYAALKGKTFSVKVKATGEVESVAGYAELLDEIFAGLNDVSFQLLKAELRKQFSNEAMKRQLSQLYQLLPGGAVNVGDSWNRQFTQPMPFVGDVTVRETFTLDRVGTANGKRIATVKVVSTYERQVGGAPMASGVPGFEMSGTIKSGTVTGSFQFDVAAGQIASSTLRQQLSAGFTARARGGDFDGLAMEIETAVDGEITLSRQESGEGDNRRPR